MTRFALMLALVMAAGIAFELTPASGDHEEPPPVLSTTVTPDRPHAADALEQKAATALSRPLFRPGRRPYAPDESVAPLSAEVVRAPRLAGIVLTPTSKAAIFAADGDRPVARSEGSRIGPFEVLLIEAGRVTLAGPAGLQVLHPVATAGPTLPSWPDQTTVQRLLDDAQAIR